MATDGMSPNYFFSHSRSIVLSDPSWHRCPVDVSYHVNFTCLVHPTSAHFANLAGLKCRQKWSLAANLPPLLRSLTQSDATTFLRQLTKHTPAQLYALSTHLASLVGQQALFSLFFFLLLPHLELFVAATPPLHRRPAVPVTDYQLLLCWATLFPAPRFPLCYSVVPCADSLDSPFFHNPHAWGSFGHLGSPAPCNTWTALNSYCGMRHLPVT